MDASANRVQSRPARAPRHATMAARGTARRDYVSTKRASPKFQRLPSPGTLSRIATAPKRRCGRLRIASILPRPPRALRRPRPPIRLVRDTRDAIRVRHRCRARRWKLKRRRHQKIHTPAPAAPTSRPPLEECRGPARRRIASAHRHNREESYRRANPSSAVTSRKDCPNTIQYTSSAAPPKLIHDSGAIPKFACQSFRNDPAAHFVGDESPARVFFPPRQSFLRFYPPTRIRFDNPVSGNPPRSRRPQPTVWRRPDPAAPPQ